MAASSAWPSSIMVRRQIRRVATAAAVFRDIATFAVRAVILRHDGAIADWATGPSPQQSERRRDKDHAGEGRVDEWHMNI
jgi:hypothetical protein